MSGGGRTARGAAAAPLLHWLLVVGGLLAAHRVLEREPAGASALWVGAVAGTALGQVVAWRRISLKALVLVGPVVSLGLVQVGALVWLAAAIRLDGGEAFDPGLAVMAFAPALVCGYASMTERGGLAAFWFPTSVWVLALVDGAGASAFGGAWSWALLCVLAALFVGFLGAREVRRVALWQGHGAIRLAASHATTVLRRSPARGLAQAGWAAAMAATTLGVTAWVAPHLWRSEPTRAPSTLHATTDVGTGGVPCCPETADGESHRLREYFPLLHPQAEAAPASAPCAACPGGSPPVEGIADHRLATSHGAGDAGGNGTAATSTGTPGGPGQASQPTTSSAAPGGTYAPPPAPVAATSTPPVVPHGSSSPSGPSSHAAFAQPAVRNAPPDVAPPLTWLVALALAGLLAQLALRPLRRLVTLRHLRAPLWSEAVDQRVSNLWQLALVGLRDAGWLAAPGEQPLAVARRAAVPGAETCAVVLERARHGARLDATDLERMGVAADEVYRAARRPLGLAARALAWLRWPLV